MSMDISYEISAVTCHVTELQREIEYVVYRYLYPDVTDKLALAKIPIHPEGLIYIIWAPLLTSVNFVLAMNK